MTHFTSCLERNVGLAPEPRGMAGGFNSGEVGTKITKARQPDEDAKEKARVELQEYLRKQVDTKPHTRIAPNTSIFAQVEEKEAKKREEKRKIEEEEQREVHVTVPSHHMTPTSFQADRIRKQQEDLKRAFDEEQRKQAEKEEKLRLENQKKAQEAEEKRKAAADAVRMRRS